MYQFRVITKFGWYWYKIENENEMNVCNNESIWNITWNFSRYYFKTSEMNVIAKFTTLSLYIVYIVSSWALKIPPSKMSRYLGTCILIKDHKTYLYLCQQYLIYLFLQNTCGVVHSTEYVYIPNTCLIPIFTTVVELRQVRTFWGYRPLESNASYWVLK